MRIESYFLKIITQLVLRVDVKWTRFKRSVRNSDSFFLVVVNVRLGALTFDALRRSRHTFEQSLQLQD